MALRQRLIRNGKPFKISSVAVVLFRKQCSLRLEPLLRSVFSSHRTGLVKSRAIIPLAAVTFGLTALTSAEEKLWSDNKLTPDQPFPAKVCAIGDSWVGYDLLLEEIGTAHRQCIVRLWLTVPIGYTVLDTAKGETPEWPRWTGSWTYITPGVEVDRFSWSIGIYKLGRGFGDEDLLKRITTARSAPAR